MAKDGLSARETALIAEARAAIARKAGAEAAKRPATAAPSPAAPVQAAPAPARAAASQAPRTAAMPIAHTPVPAQTPAPAKADPAVIAARIAAMMEAERAQTLRRKQKMKQAGTAIVVIAFVPVILWAAAKLILQLAAR